MTTLATWPDLADAVLDRVTVDWRNAQARVDFLPSSTLLVASWIRAHDVRRVVVPQAQAPGTSASARVRAVRRESGHLAIEMRSGDIIVIEAGRFAFERSDG
jgi:hypothetical protein